MTTTALTTHPVAELFPMLATDELAELAEDIKQRGLLHPIVLDSEGRILDGRNRHAACLLAEVEPEFVTYDGDDADGYAVAVNIARRNLTTGARAIIAAKAARLNGHGGQKKIAAETKISNLRISDANVILDWAPDLAAEVIAGAPLSAALAEARERKAEAAQIQAKINRLHEAAPDLALLIDESELGIDDAIAALDAREAKAKEAADAAVQAEALRAQKRREAAAEINEWLGTVIDRLGAYSDYPHTALTVYEEFNFQDTSYRRPVNKADLDKALAGIKQLAAVWKDSR